MEDSVLGFWICSIGIWPVSPFSLQKLCSKALQSNHALTLASYVDLEKALVASSTFPHGKFIQPYHVGLLSL